MGRAGRPSSILLLSCAKIKAAPWGLPCLFQLWRLSVYFGFLCTGGFLAGAGAALVNRAPFSMTITNGLGV